MALRIADGSSVLRAIELQALDWRFRWRGPLPATDAVVIAAVDDRTITRLGRWPLPRTRIAEAVDRLSAAGARIIGLDLLLSEPNPALPAETAAAIALARELLPPEALAVRARLDAVLAGADPDLSLATAIAAADRVVMPFAFVFGEGEANIAGVPEFIRRVAYPVMIGEEAAAAAPPAAGLVVPAPGLGSVGITLGHVTLLVDIDGSLRFSLPAFAHAGDLYPSLAVEAVRSWAGLARERVVVRLGQSIDVGPHRIPTDLAMRQYINYLGPTGTLPTVSLIDVLDGTVDPALIDGRIVLIGVSAAGAGDRFATPFAQRLPGVEHLGTAVDNIIEGRALVRDRQAAAVDVIAVVLLAGLGSALGGRRSVAMSAVAAAILAGGWSAIALAAFVGGHWWLSAVVPAACGLLAVTSVETVRITAEQRRRRRLEWQRGNLARYFPPTLVDRLAEEAGSLERTQPAAVMFVDIVGSTGLLEPLPPAEAMDLLRGFHARVEDAIFAHGGVVDKFMGDGALACFGVPDPAPDAVVRALHAAFGLQAALHTWAAERASRGQAPVRAGIGIHYGSVLMGDIGGRKQFQFTVIGDTVNVASRLEALTREHDALIIVSDEAVEAARAAPGGQDSLPERLQPLPEPVRVSGRRAPLRLWRVARGPR